MWDSLKILGNGKLSKALKVSAHHFSAQAREKIQAAGGQAIDLPGPAPVVKKQKKVSRKKPAGR
ncbi:MAG: uL15 family ribosomal protein [bacterium]